MAVRITEADRYGRRFAYLFCHSCEKEHSFGTVYPHGALEIQFPEEFGLDRKTAESILRRALNNGA